MIDDLGEVAQLATEYINSLENLPQEVQHIIKEIEHKDAKVQEMLPKLAAREGQLRELLAKKEVLTDVDKVKMDKLGEKIKVDYTRADEWSMQKEMLSKKLWRSVVSHQRRLYQEIDKISPVLIKQVESQLPIQNGALGSASSSTSLANLPALLAGFKSPSIDGEMLFAAGSGGGLKRKHGSSSQLARDSPTLSTKGGRQSSIDRLSPALTLTTSGSSNINGVNAFVPTTGHASISKKALKSSGLSTMLAAKVEPDIELDADGEADEGAGGDGEKDTKLYCHCQRVSFGEMIGCDNDDCPYEWFHLSCVGLSKPLPQTWYCEHCREKMEREKSEKPAKKRKR